MLARMVRCMRGSSQNIAQPRSSQPRISAVSRSICTCCKSRSPLHSSFRVQRINSNVRGTMRPKLSRDKKATKLALSVKRVSSSESVSTQMPASSISPIITRV